MERRWEEVQRHGHDLAGRFAALTQGLRRVLRNSPDFSTLSSSYPSSGPAQQSEHRFIPSCDPLSSGECCEVTTSSSWPWPWIGKPSSKSSFLLFSKVQVNDGKSQAVDLSENCSNIENKKFRDHDCSCITTKPDSKDGENMLMQHSCIKKGSRKNNRASVKHDQQDTKFTNRNRSMEKNGITHCDSEKGLNINRRTSMNHISAHSADENDSKKEKSSSIKHDFPYSIEEKISNRERKRNHDSTHSSKDCFSGGEKMAFMNHDLHEIEKLFGLAKAELGACINGFVNEFTKYLSLPFQRGFLPSRSSLYRETDCEDDYLNRKETSNDNHTTCSAKDRCVIQNRSVTSRNRTGDEMLKSEESNAFYDGSNEELFGLFINRQSQLYRQGSVNVSTIYDSRTREIESSVTARGDLWRAEATHGRNNSGNGSSPLFLLQVGPILFVRDSTLLLPIHLSKQHLLWYGFDRKNGLHSICPAMWSKRRRWLVMSMICLNPFNCSFMDIQFPNGQLTYVAGEGITSSAFFPVLGGLLQAQCAHPDIFKLSFSKKMWWGTRVTPSVQLPDRAWSVDVLHPLAWQRSGMIVRPTVELRFTPTIGGRNAGWKAEFVHSPKERLSWSCGCALTIQPTAYASISFSNAKRNSDDVGRAGLVLRVETPVENPTQASFQIQLNSGVEF